MACAYTDAPRIEPTIDRTDNAPSSSMTRFPTTFATTGCSPPACARLFRAYLIGVVSLLSSLSTMNTARSFAGSVLLALRLIV